MKRFVFFSLLSCLSCVYGGDNPVRDLKLTSDANANGYSLTNLNAAFILQIGGDTKESIDEKFSGLYQGTKLIMSFVDSILYKTNLWNVAYSWGDWHSTVALKLDAAATNGWHVGKHLDWLLSVPPLDYSSITNPPWITSAPPQSVVSVNGKTGAVVITASDISCTQIDRIITQDGKDWIDATGGVWRVGWFPGPASFTGWELEIDYPVNVNGEMIGPCTNRVYGAPYPLWANATSHYATVEIPLEGYTEKLMLTYLHTTGYTPNNAYIYSDAEDSTAQWYANYDSVESTNTVRSFLGHDDDGQIIWIRLRYGTSGPLVYSTQRVDTVGLKSDLFGLVATPQLDAALAHSHSYITNSRPTFAQTTGIVQNAISQIPTPDMADKVNVSNGSATNLSVFGALALPQSAPTNLVLRLVCSNEHIFVQEVYQ